MVEGTCALRFGQCLIAALYSHEIFLCHRIIGVFVGMTFKCFLMVCSLDVARRGPLINANQFSASVTAGNCVCKSHKCKKESSCIRDQVRDLHSIDKSLQGPKITIARRQKILRKSWQGGRSGCWLRASCAHQATASAASCCAAALRPMTDIYYSLCLPLPG